MTQDPNMPGGMPPQEPGPPLSGDPSAYNGPPPTKEDQSMAMLAHLLGILGFLGPLIIWLLKKDQSPFVNDQGREALNFQLTVLIGYIVGWLLIYVFCIGLLIVFPLMIASLVLHIIAAMKANQGIAYRYPFSIKFIK